jgi:Methyltransferase domain
VTTATKTAPPPKGRSVTSSFFEPSYRQLVHQPNGHPWWHSLPLPDGDRIAGVNPDHNLQLKMWQAFGIDAANGLRSRKVLDIGANDGFFTIASALAGADHVTAINNADWGPTYPDNLAYGTERWGVAPEILIGDFRTHAYTLRYDVILFLGVLYHLENVFAAMALLRGLLVDGGEMYLETQLSQIDSPLPLYEAASDIYPTIARQDKGNLGRSGLSNFLFPNEAAIRNLAHAYDFACENLGGVRAAYTRENPTRGVFRLTKR